MLCNLRTRRAARAQVGESAAAREAIAPDRTVATGCLLRAAAAAAA
jgi:hypothetical protein